MKQSYFHDISYNSDDFLDNHNSSLDSDNPSDLEDIENLLYAKVHYDCGDSQIDDYTNFSVNVLSVYDEIRPLNRNESNVESSKSCPDSMGIQSIDGLNNSKNLSSKIGKSKKYKKKSADSHYCINIVRSDQVALSSVRKLKKHVQNDVTIAKSHYKGNMDSENCEEYHLSRYAVKRYMKDDGCKDNEYTNSTNNLSSALTLGNESSDDSSDSVKITKVEYPVKPKNHEKSKSRNNEDRNLNDKRNKGDSSYAFIEIDSSSDMSDIPKPQTNILESLSDSDENCTIPLGENDCEEEKSFTINVDGSVKWTTIDENPEMWKIEDIDRRNFTGRKESRYFSECKNCRKTGHSSKECLRSKKQRSCCLCGEKGHISRSCSYAKCRSCFAPGKLHTTTCRSQAAEIRCKRCRSFGHTSAACPDLWRRYHSTVSSGDIVKLDSEDRKRMLHQPYCSNCAGRHLFNRCHLRRMFVGDRVTSVPQVVSYESKFISSSISWNRGIKDRVLRSSLVTRESKYLNVARGSMVKLLGGASKQNEYLTPGRGSHTRQSRGALNKPHYVDDELIDNKNNKMARENHKNLKKKNLYIKNHRSHINDTKCADTKFRDKIQRTKLSTNLSDFNLNYETIPTNLSSKSQNINSSEMKLIKKNHLPHNKFLSTNVNKNDFHTRYCSFDTNPPIWKRNRTSASKKARLRELHVKRALSDNSIETFKRVRRKNPQLKLLDCDNDDEALWDTNNCAATSNASFLFAESLRSLGYTSNSGQTLKNNQIVKNMNSNGIVDVNIRRSPSTGVTNCDSNMLIEPSTAPSSAVTKKANKGKKLKRNARKYKNKNDRRLLLEQNLLTNR